MKARKNKNRNPKPVTRNLKPETQSPKSEATGYGLRATGNKAGYTLVEMMIAVLIFSVVMVTVSASLVNLSRAERNAKAIQRNLENAKFGVEIMAKNIRVSDIISCNNDTNLTDGDDCDAVSAPVTQIEIYNYSQRQCIQYRFNNHKAETRVAATGESSDCNLAFNENEVDSPYVSMMDEDSYIDKMTFIVNRTYDAGISGSKVGKITILMEVCAENQDGACPVKSDKFPVQTSVSLRI